MKSLLITPSHDGSGTHTSEPLRSRMASKTSSDLDGLAVAGPFLPSRARPINDVRRISRQQMTDMMT